MIRVLCAGDIHIGRRASKVHGSYRSADAWSAIVDRAIAEDVHLLALSGDIIDKESKSYEALGPMQHGLTRLRDAGIETVAVAGNHDHDVLVRLAGITGSERFHLLGRGGTWERFTFAPDGVPLLHIDGWSFPKEHVTDSPLHGYVEHDPDDVPVLGLLHGDVGEPLSSYGPISLGQLWALPIDFALLGHIHAPREYSGPGGKLALYPGSPWALDPGEPGTHGVWMAEFDHHSVTLEQLPISPVRYAGVTVNLAGVADEGGFQEALNDSLLRVGNEAIAAHGEGLLKVVSARLRCVGRCPAYRLVPTWIGQALPNLSHYPVGSIHIEVDTFTLEVRPSIDLSQVAEGTDPAAETARLILALESVALEQPYGGLVEMTLRDMNEIYRHPGYASLRVNDRAGNDPTEADARMLLSSRAWETLSSLVSQKEEV